MESIKEINIIFHYESLSIKELKCEMKDILEDIFKKFTLQMRINLENLIFLYSGKQIEDYKIPLSSLINKIDKERNEMNILVYDIDTPDKNTINIIFLYESENIVKKTCKKKDKVRDICMTFAQEIGIDFTTIIFMYGGMELNLDRTFIELANEYDKSCNGMTILAYKKTKPLIVNFLYKNKSDKIKCSKNDKLYNICIFYALKNKLQFEKLFFYYQKSRINWFQTFNDLLIENNTNINETQMENIKNLNDDEIEITVEYCCAPCCIINKKKIIRYSIISCLLVVLLYILVAVFIAIGMNIN